MSAGSFSPAISRTSLELLKSSPRVSRDSSQDNFDCWPELAISLLLTSIALFFEDCAAVVSTGGVLTTIFFLARQFMRGNLRLLSPRTCAIVGYGGWMFLGMFRYVSGLDAYLGLSEAGYAISSDLLHRVTLFAAIGFTAMLVGLQSGGTVPLIRKALFTRTLSSKACLVAAFLCIATALPLQLQHNNFWGFVPQMPFYVGIIAPLCVPAVLLLSYAVATDRKFARRHAVLIAALFCIASGVIALETSRRSPLVAVLGSVFVLAWFQRRASLQRQFWTLCGGAALTLLLYLGGNAIRAVSFSDKTSEGFIEEYKLLNTQAKSVQGFYMFTFVVDNYPTSYPFLNGSSVVAAVLNFVPRQYWPSKPIGFAKEVAFRLSGIPVSYGYSRELDEASGYQSYSGTLVGESYANFGPLGIPLLLFAFGVIVTVLEKYLLAAPNNQFTVLVCAASVGSILIQQRGDIVSANFFTVHAIGIFAIIFLVAGQRKKICAS